MRDPKLTASSAVLLEKIAQKALTSDPPVPEIGKNLQSVGVHDTVTLRGDSNVQIVATAVPFAEDAHCLQLLHLLLVTHASALAEPIAQLDPFPATPLFADISRVRTIESIHPFTRYSYFLTLVLLI